MAGYEIQGLDRLFRKLAAVRAVELLVPPMERSQARVQQSIARYPVKPQGSRYPRTGTLGRRWTSEKVSRSSNGVSGIVGNNTGYARWVQDETRQTDKHRATGWITDGEVLRRVRSDIESDFLRVVDAALAI